MGGTSSWEEPLLGEGGLAVVVEVVAAAFVVAGGGESGAGAATSSSFSFFLSWTGSGATGCSRVGLELVGVSSASIRARRRKRSSREVSIDSISSWRSCSICASDMDASCRAFSCAMAVFSSFGLGAEAEADADADGAGSRRCLKVEGLVRRR